VTEDDLQAASGSWTTPPEAARMCEEADKVLAF
jgi:hypothetical protein